MPKLNQTPDMLFGPHIRILPSQCLQHLDRRSNTLAHAFEHRTAVVVLILVLCSCSCSCSYYSVSLPSLRNSMMLLSSPATSGSFKVIFSSSSVSSLGQMRLHTPRVHSSLARTASTCVMST